MIIEAVLIEAVVEYVAYLLYIANERVAYVERLYSTVTVFSTNKFCCRYCAD